MTSKQLKAWRGNRTLVEVGKLTGFHWNTIWRMEHGVRKISPKIEAFIKAEGAAQGKKPTPSMARITRKR